MILLSLIFALSLPGDVINRTQSENPRIVILGYHEVEPDGVPPHVTIPREAATKPPQDEMAMYTVTTADFRAQLDALATHGYVVISMKDLEDFLYQRRSTLPPRSVVVTADDGWVSAKSQMLPEIARRGMPFTVFVYPRVVDRHSHHPFNLTWDDISGMSREGVDIESHTYSHPFLSRARHAELDQAQYAAWLEQELRGSGQLLSQHTGQEVRFVAYPFGDYDDSVLTAARAAGYTVGVTVKPGVVRRGDDPLALKRFLVTHDTTQQQFESWLERAN